MTDYFELGRILKPQGVRGEVKVEAYTDNMERFLSLPHIYVKECGGYVKKELAEVRTDGKFAYLRLEGTANRDQAEALRGTMLYIDRAHAAKLPPGRYYISDLIGMRVEDNEGRQLGSLKDILQTGSADVYQVKLDEGGELMFPSAPGVILSRDVEEGRMTVDRHKLSEVAVYDL